MLGKRKDSFVEEAGSPGEKVDSYPKEPTPQVLLRDYVGKRGGATCWRGGNLLRSEMTISVLWFQVAVSWGRPVGSCSVSTLRKN